MWGDAQDHYGSSPRMRGAHLVNGCLGNDSGIIPAYAGSTIVSCLCPSSRWDHPRVCGEHPRTRHPTRSRAGSSPRMRGAPMQSLSPLRKVQGSSPRMRGALFGVRGVAFRTGSSPRMRGALRQGEKDAAPRGIIPAYAGSTALAFRPSGQRRDHPRVCGEHEVKMGDFALPSGSSPRMRGAPPGC